LGLLPPQDIRAIRERLGQPLEHFARLIGVKADRLSLWEDGTLWQDRTTDRLIRLLDWRGENVDHLETLLNRHAGEARKQDTQGQPAATKSPEEDTVPTPSGKAEIGRSGGIRRIKILGPDA
jgi:hypothetical protein